MSVLGNDRLFLELSNQWINPFTCNWFDFTIFSLGGEWNSSLGNLEGSLVILGVGVRLVWNYDNQTELSLELKDILENLKISVAIPKDEYDEFKKWKEGKSA